MEVARVLQGLIPYQRTLPSFEKRNKTTFKITAEPGSYQIDYIFMPHPKQNKGYVGFFLAIEITSRKAYTYLIRDKGIDTAAGVLTQFINQVHPKSVASDNESAFTSKTIQDLLDNHGIAHTKHAPNDHNAMGIADRMARTIKDMMNKYFLAEGTLVWYDVLPDLIANYNKRVHGSLHGQSPIQVAGDTEAQKDIRAESMAHNRQVLNKTANFAAGDLVRVREPLEKLEKGRPRYSDDTYTIVKLEGLSYKLQNAAGNIIRRQYRPYELVKATEPDDVRLADVIKQGRRANRIERREKAALGEDARANIIPKSARATAQKAASKLRNLIEERAV